MTKKIKKFDKGIQLDPSYLEGTEEGELYLDANDNKVKIFLGDTIQELNTTTLTTAASIIYDNASSMLNATNLQDAIDEIKALIDSLG